jgi:hypothetical protein
VVTPYSRAENNLEQIEKEAMTTIYYEQPSVIKDTYRGGYMQMRNIQMSGVEDNSEKFLNAEQNHYRHVASPISC